MADQAWKRGDSVRHPERPEWGVGSITKVEATSHEGKPCQRLTVRFELGGLKTLSTAFAKLRPAGSTPGSAATGSGSRTGQSSRQPTRTGGRDVAPDGSSIRSGRPSSYSPNATAKGRPSNDRPEKGWLDELERVRPADRLVTLPEDVTDPFSSPIERLRRTLQLYRFTGVGASLIDWAVMQTGLRDPLSELNRHELEDHFRSFRRLLDEHLRNAAREADQADARAAAELVQKAAPEARTVLARRHGRR